MREAILCEVQTGHRQCLALRFIDADGETEPEGELEPLELERNVRWDDGNSWNVDVLGSRTASDDGRLDDVFMEGFDDQAGSVAQLGRVHVSQEHDRSAHFQVQKVSWYSGWLQVLVLAGPGNCASSWALTLLARAASGGLGND